MSASDAVGADTSETPVRAGESTGDGSLAHARAIARIEVVRSARTLGDETNKLVGIVVSGLVLVGVTLVGTAALYLFGDRALAITTTEVDYLRGAFAGYWLLIAGMTAFRTVAVVGDIDGAPGMLTTTSPRAVAGGLLLGEAIRHALHLVLPALLLAGALSVGAGQPLAGPGFLLAGLLAWTSAFPVGYLAGQAVQYLSRGVSFVRRNRITLGVVAMVGYMGIVVKFGDVALVLAGTPVGWYADVGLQIATGAGSAGQATLAAVTTVATAPLALVGSYTLAIANWYGDTAVDPEDGDTSATYSGTILQRLGSALDRVASRPTAAVARASWLRARRSPFKLTYAMVPAFAFVGYLAPSLGDGHVPDLLPVMVGGYAAWSIGALFTLNPIGDEGPLLPVTLTSGVSGAAFVRGRMIAAWMLGVPPTLVLVAVANGLVGFTLPSLGLSLAYALVLTLVAPGLSVGVGTAIPNFDTQQVMLNREAVVPSVVAFMLFLLLLGIVGLPGGLALLFFAGDGGSASLLTSIQVGGVAASLVLGLLVAGPSYVYAVRRFDGYEVDR